MILFRNQCAPQFIVMLASLTALLDGLDRLGGRTRSTQLTSFDSGAMLSDCGWHEVSDDPLSLDRIPLNEKDAGPCFKKEVLLRRLFMGVKKSIKYG